MTKPFEDFATGRFTKEEVLDTVTRLGLRTRKGLTLNPQSFGRMLTNRLYAGFMEVPEFGVSRRGDFDPLVSEDTFHRVQVISQGRVPVATPHQRGRPDFPLKGPRSLRDMRQDADRELVEGPERAVRVLPLLAPMPRGQRHESQARKPIRRRVGTATANAWLHAAGEGACSAWVGRT